MDTAFSRYVQPDFLRRRAYHRLGAGASGRAEERRAIGLDHQEKCLRHAEQFHAAVAATKDSMLKTMFFKARIPGRGAVVGAKQESGWENIRQKGAALEHPVCTCPPRKTSSNPGTDRLEGVRKKEEIPCSS